MLFRRSSIALGLSVLLLTSSSNAERVGFEFTGELQVLGSGNVSIFSVSVPKTSPVKGTFSFDTAESGIEVSPGVQEYRQTIAGGFSLVINGGGNGNAIDIAASDYIIAVANDADSPATDSFSVDYNYDINAMPPTTPAKLIVNGIEWTGTRAFMRTFLSWDSTAFGDSKLSADKPLTPDWLSTALVGNSSQPRFFSITSVSSIEPTIGDYNFDGAVDYYDYIEWQKAFGTPKQYADGNMDGVVDAADYVVWRDSLGTTSLSVNTSVPEPNQIYWSAALLTALTLRFVRPRN